LLADERVYSFVLLAERPELVTKLGGSLLPLDLDFTGKGFEIHDVFGAFVFLNLQKFHVECILI
jgi:hypothetical protein